MLRAVLFFVLAFASLLAAQLAPLRNFPLLANGAVCAAILALHVPFLRAEGSTLSSLGLARPGLLAIGVLFGAALSAAVLLPAILGGALQAPATRPGAIELVRPLPGTLLIVIWEELWFRGYLLLRLRDRLGPGAATAITAAAFTALHLLNPQLPATALAGISAAGLLLAALVLRTGSILPAIGCHLAWNSLHAAARSTFGIALPGAALLFGEDGIVGTVVVAAAALVALRPLLWRPAILRAGERA